MLPKFNSRTENPRASLSIREVRCLIFRNYSRLFVLRRILLHNTHGAVHKHQYKTFDSVLAKLVQNVRLNDWTKMQEKVIKTPQNTLRSIMCLGRVENRHNEGCSGNIEVVSDFVHLLEDLILVEDKCGVEKKKKNEDLRKREVSLICAKEREKYVALTKRYAAMLLTLTKIKYSHTNHMGGEYC